MAIAVVAYACAIFIYEALYLAFVPVMAIWAVSIWSGKRPVRPVFALLARFVAVQGAAIVYNRAVALALPGGANKLIRPIDLVSWAVARPIRGLGAAAGCVPTRSWRRAPVRVRCEQPRS